MKFLDTNIIIRYLTKDDPEKAARAYAFLQAVERGEEVITTTEAVIAEVVYILSSKKWYNYPRAEIVKKLVPVLQLKGMRLSHKNWYLEALNLYEHTNIDFVDTLIIAKMHNMGVTTLVSFDRDFDGYPFITREEPTSTKTAA